MSGVFYKSVIYGLGFFICFDIDFTGEKSKHAFCIFCHSDKTWVFDQSERAQGPVYIMKILNCSKFHTITLLLYE